MDSVYDIIKDSKKISGPWRCAIYAHPDEKSPPTVIFSEEHDNKGSCPNETHIISVLKDILNGTDNAHVFIENFIYANDIENFGNRNVNSACKKPGDNEQVLNHMRKCLEIIRSSRSHLKDRIHFIDPRVDLIAILPNGKIYDAIDIYVKDLASNKKYSDIILTLYEAFIHPLMNLFPDNLILTGRLSGAIKEAKSKMTNDQLVFFEKTWKYDVLDNVSGLIEFFSSMKNKKNNYNYQSIIQDVEKVKILYRDMTNKFLDTWLLAKLFVAENETNMDVSIMYLGSLHSLHMESYFKDMGYILVDFFENKGLLSCINIDK